MTKTESTRELLKVAVIHVCEELLQCEMAAGVRLAIPDTDALIMVGPADWIAKNVPGVEAIADLSQFGSIRDYADFREDLERLSAPGLAKAQAKIIRKEIYDVIDARVKNSITAYRLAATTQASTAQAEPTGWISVDERLPEGTCLASYQPHRRGHKPCVIRAVYFKQYQIEASGEEGESTDYNEANDTDYIKAGWYERIDNWGDFASVSVCEGVVTHWMPLPAAPVALRSATATGSGDD